MPQPSDIAFQPFQNQTGGNVLSEYMKGQQEAEDRKRAMQRQDRQDQMANQQNQYTQQEHALKMAQTVVGWLGAVPDGDVQGFERVKQQWVQAGLPPEMVAPYTAADLPILRQKAGADLEKMKRDYLSAQIGTEQAQGRAYDASAAASRANADYIRGGKVGGGAGGGRFGPGGKPLTERESKDLGWALRGEAANKEFTPDRVKHLIDARNTIGRNMPIVGNKLQTDLSRQAVQTAKNFVAVVLRKDTGAAVTDHEFDFYDDIFIPQWGDDDTTLQMKSNARSGFLHALKTGLGPRAALAQLGITPPEGLAPPEDDKTSVIENPSMGGWSATVEE